MKADPVGPGGGTEAWVDSRSVRHRELGWAWPNGCARVRASLTPALQSHAQHNSKHELGAMVSSVLRQLHDCRGKKGTRAKTTALLCMGPRSALVVSLYYSKGDFAPNLGLDTSRCQANSQARQFPDRHWCSRSLLSVPRTSHVRTDQGPSRCAVHPGPRHRGPTTPGIGPGRAFLGLGFTSHFADEQRSHCAWYLLLTSDLDQLQPR